MIDETGNRYGRLTVVARSGSGGKREVIWSCRCDCGGHAEVVGTVLRKGHSRSCGCLQRESMSQRTRIHGHAVRRTGIYRSWQSMIQRCTNSRRPDWPYYGGRRITVCDRWLTFENFLADMGERPPEPPGWDSRVSYWSLDRIDNDGDYEPGNCRWATPSEQAQNRRVA